MIPATSHIPTTRISNFAVLTMPRHNIRIHFPFGPRGSTVSRKHWKETNLGGFFAWLAAHEVVPSTLDKRASQAAFFSKASMISHGAVPSLTHSTHAQSAEADVVKASRQQSTAVTLLAKMAIIG